MGEKQKSNQCCDKNSDDSVDSPHVIFHNCIFLMIKYLKQVIYITRNQTNQTKFVCYLDSIQI